MKNRVRRYVTDGLSPIPRRTWLQLAALLIALLAAWPLLSGNGLLNTRGGGDSPFLLQRLHQLTSALADGHFPVRWMPDANYGYGYPFFNYYAPLSVYVAAIFRFAGLSYVHSLQLAQLAGFLLAAWAVFHLAERWFGNDWAALLAAAAYTLAPFHMVNVYVRGDSLAEFWAMALYPVVLLAADRITMPGKNRWRGVVFLAIAYGALILSHNISALIFSPFLLLYLLLRLGQQRQEVKTLAGYVIGALLLGLALAAWFWVPALAEKALVQTAPITEGYFHYSGHFWGRDLVQVRWLFDYDVTGRSAFRLGLVQVLLAGAGVLALLFWNRGNRDRRLGVVVFFILATLAVATVMITPISRPLWDTLPLLPFTQFPWRFLSVQALAGALATGAIVLVPGDRWQAAITTILILFLLVAALGDLPTDHLALTDGDVSARRLAEYEWFTGNIGSTVSAEYLPETVHPRPYTSPWLERGARDHTQVIAGEASTSLLTREATEQRWEVNAGAGGATVLFPTLYWPGWQASSDGQPLAGGPATGSGLFAVDIPAGRHTVTLTLERTPVRLLAEGISLLGLFLLLGIAYRCRRGPFRWRMYLFLLGFGVLLLLLLRLWPERARWPAALTWDFAQMGYLHHAPEGIPFSNGARLLEYTYSRDSLMPGEKVVITLEWEPASAGDMGTPLTVALATPAVHRYQTAPLLLAQRQPLTGGQSAFSFSLPPDAPSGLYVPRLKVAGAAPLLASGDTRGDLFLRPLRIVAPAKTADPGYTLQVNASEVTVVGEPPVRGEAGRPVACETARPGSLLVTMEWTTPRPLSANYVTSLRLLDREGRLLAQCDVQPGYGFQPSSGWPVGHPVYDRLVLSLPGKLPDAAPYPLVTRLYLPGGENLLTRRLGELQWKEGALAFVPARPSFTLPQQMTPTTARFGEVAALRGYQLDVRANTLSLTLYWEALAAGENAYVRFVHLIDPATGQIIERADGSTVQRDGIPRQDSYPTSQWTAGEIITDPVSLSLAGVPAGNYRLSVGFYPSQDPANRLPVSEVEGAALTPGSFLFPETVAVPPATD